MRHTSRTYVAIGLLAALVAAAGAAVQTNPGPDARQAIVRTALEKLGRPADDPALLEAAPRAHLLSTVTFDGADGACVLLHTQGQPLFDHLVIDGGAKLVVDLYDTLNALSGTKFVPEKRGRIRQVRTSLYALEPRFVSRIAIDLDRACEPRIHQEAGLIRIELSPAPATAAAPLAARLEQQARRVAIRETGFQEQMNRWSARRTALENGLEASLGASARLLAQGKKSLLAARLEQAVPRTAALRRDAAGAGDAAAALLEIERALADGKAEARSRIAQHDRALSEFGSMVSAHAARVRERLDYDLKTVRMLEERMASQQGADDPQAGEILAVLETKLDRLAGEDLGPLDELSSRAGEAIVAHADFIGATASAVAASRQALESRAAQRPDAQPVRNADGADVALSALQNEVARRQTTVAASPQAPAVFIVPALSPAPAVAKASTNPRVAQLATELEAVKDAELRFALQAIAPMAALADNREQEEEPVADAAVEESAAPAEGAAVPEEPAAPVTPPAEPPAPQPAPPVPPAPAPPAVELTVEPPQKSEIVVTPTPDDGSDPTGDITALNEPVNLDLREMDLSNFVALLARKAGINVIAGTELSGTVTASIRNVPLIQALQMVLRMHDLGVVEEEGVYRIIPYADAEATERVTRMITLQNANVEEVKLTLDNILMNAPDARSISVAANPGTSVLIVSGAPKRVEELEALVQALDVAEPVTPTVTEAIKLNYALPDEVAEMVKGMLSKEVGKSSVDLRGRHIVITDYPPVVEQVRQLIQNIDTPVKQVAVESMIVDAVLSDGAETGVDWVLNAVRRTNRRGEIVGSLQQGSFEADLGNVGASALDAGLITFDVLTDEIGIRAAIAAEANARNAEILSTPQLIIAENETGNISIVDEFPYQEITQTTQGPPVATTEFKPIGVTLEVSPRVTHNNDIITEVQAKQSSVNGITETGVPIEAKREASTTLSIRDGQTIFIGGLRRHDDRLEVNKVPVLGDIPVVNFLFRNTKGEKVNSELMIFLTCRVLGEHLPELTPKQQENFEKLGETPEVPDAQRSVFRSFWKPGEMRDPLWKRSQPDPQPGPEDGQPKSTEAQPEPAEAAPVVEESPLP